MTQPKKVLLTALVVALVMGGAGSAYFAFRDDVVSEARAEDIKDSADPEVQVPVEVVAAIRGPIVRTLTTASTLEAEQSAEVLAKVSGVVTEIHVNEGGFVEEGQLLAKVDDEEKKLALDRAELTLKRAEAELQRSKLSFDQKLISEFDYEKARFDRDLAAAELETAKLEHRYTDVRAPFRGRVTAKEIVTGKTIQPGDHLFTLADFTTLVLKLFLPEKDVFELEPGQPVRLVPEALADVIDRDNVHFQGRVRDISPVVDPKTGTVKVTVAVVDPTRSARPGAFVRAEIETDRRTDAVLVPKIALVREDGRDSVYVADAESGVAQERDVELGYTRAGVVQIVAGVEEGELVIVGGQTTLSDGDRIEILRPE